MSESKLSSSLQEGYELLNRMIIERRQNFILNKWTKNDCSDDQLKSDLLPLERIFSKLRSMVTAAENTKDHLLFEEQKLKQDCDRLEEQLRIHIQESNAMVTKKEETIRNHELRLRKTKARLSLYEQMTGIKIMINENSTTAFIYNPNEVLQHAITHVTTESELQKPDPILEAQPELDNSNPTEQTSTDRHAIIDQKQVDEINDLWSRLKPSENWEHLIEPDLQCTRTLTSQNKPECHRPPLALLDDGNRVMNQ